METESTGPIAAGARYAPAAPARTGPRPGPAGPAASRLPCRYAPRGIGPVLLAAVLAAGVVQAGPGSGSAAVRSETRPDTAAGGTCRLSSAQVTQAVEDAQARLARLRAERDALNAFYWDWYGRLSQEELDCRAFESAYAPLRGRLAALDGSAVRAALQESYRCILELRESLTRMPPNQAIASRISELNRRRKSVDDMLSELAVIAGKQERLTRGFKEVFLDACASFH